MQSVRADCSRGDSMIHHVQQSYPSPLMYPASWEVRYVWTNKNRRAGRLKGQTFWSLGFPKNGYEKNLVQCVLGTRFLQCF